jgi:hypothetical protein
MAGKPRGDALWRYVAKSVHAHCNFLIKESTFVIYKCCTGSITKREGTMKSNQDTTQGNNSAVKTVSPRITNIEAWLGIKLAEAAKNRQSGPRARSVAATPINPKSNGRV